MGDWLARDNPSHALQSGAWHYQDCPRSAISPRLARLHPGILGSGPRFPTIAGRVTLVSSAHGLLCPSPLVRLVNHITDLQERQRVQQHVKRVFRSRGHLQCQGTGERALGLPILDLFTISQVVIVTGGGTGIGRG